MCYYQKRTNLKGGELTDEAELLKKRMTELHDRSDSRGIWTYSDFLSLAEQSELLSLKLPDTSLFGGYDGAERRLAVFGSEESCGYAEPAPITCVRIEPLSMKFADALSHRDFLGSILGAGIDRAVLGDIIVRDNIAWAFCRDTVAEFIISSVTSVKHTAVKCAAGSAPEFANEKPPESRAVVASERLDAVIAGVYSLSRAEGKQTVTGGKVYLDGRLCENPSAEIKPGTVVSVRGTGRFIYCGMERETRRGRLSVAVRKY